ncbi:DUF1801 domain-containing protein [Dyadobacter chenwenxiniae]|uniref:DUF1801 domain-containing protein n=1 Tax=Dyadobacter chenwenxiniae TaxID=2906456 RepID=A0A9X1PKZ2_9BACT|nr:DUF1801 domain-containing protein [Dyadobacter chenwenxiniae]MCF0051525.1 DUF1801 domain-containing protein [Dyadobacter chenwenxiniae]MCF0060711.1 DUF1801 domain-containing protein [Dyadobacter chenwenxiniae]UON80545.1 DUF1801 domain-containing protein [Dyadobacter chenwenxiniae]
MPSTKPKTIDEYISNFPPEVRQALQEIRETVRKVAPDAEETISYDMPTFNLNGSYLIYFAAWKKHIALYPVSATLAASLKDDLSGYKGTKGSVHFPLDKRMPLELIEKIVTWRLEENSKS